MKTLIEVQDFALVLRLDGAGWFKARFAVAGGEHDFTVSYLSEPLADFLSTILDLDAYYDGRYETIGNPEFHLRWQGEPWSYGWLFEPQAGEVLRVTLAYRTGHDDNPDEIRFAGLLSFRALARQVYEQARAIFREHGFLGYRNEWDNSDFPIGDFLRLHDVLSGRTSPAPLGRGRVGPARRIAQMKLVNTPQGEVRLLPPPVELLRAIRAFMPFGAVRYVPPQQGADFGLIMQCGEQELFAVKQQPMDCDKEQSPHFL